MQLKLKFTKFEDINKFINIANTIPCDIEAHSKKYIVNAKSIIGLFSLDLAEPIDLIIHGTDEKYSKMFAEWIVK